MCMLYAVSTTSTKHPINFLSMFLCTCNIYTHPKPSSSGQQTPPTPPLLAVHCAHNSNPLLTLHSIPTATSLRNHKPFRSYKTALCCHISDKQGRCSRVQRAIYIKGGFWYWLGGGVYVMSICASKNVRNCVWV